MRPSPENKSDKSTASSDEASPRRYSAVIVASLGAGAVAGSLLFTPGLSLAQEDDTTTEDTSETDTSESSGVEESGSEDRPPFGHHPRRGHRLGGIAELIGIEADDLKEALRDGQTIAEVAEANGVDPDELVDQLVADATARLEEKLAELPDKIEDIVNGELEFGRHGPRGPEDAPAEED